MLIVVIKWGKGGWLLWVRYAIATTNTAYQTRPSLGATLLSTDMPPKRSFAPSDLSLDHENFAIAASTFSSNEAQDPRIAMVAEVGGLEGRRVWGLDVVGGVRKNV